MTPPLHQLWAINLGGAVSYPLVVGKLVYVTVANTGSYGTQLYALDKATGATVWGPVALGGTYYWSGLTYDNSRIFALNYDGLLRAFDATTGTLAWNTQLPGQYSVTSPPTALNGVVGSAANRRTDPPLCTQPAGDPHGVVTSGARDA